MTNISIVQIFHILFICSPVVYIYHFHHLPVVNGTEHSCTFLFVWTPIFSFDCTPKSGITGSHGNSVNFLRNHGTVCHTNCTIYIPISNVQGSSFSHSRQCIFSIFWVFLNSSHLAAATAAAAAAKSLQSCLTPCDPIDGSPPGSPIPGIL